ncbi:protein of unknown function (plasmid) [Agrobacterium pusense]|uniref:Uncharacterized protein n=1 Tax=Agrobacterium pusense TaxID=648995 RepID=U4Q7S4_9HYPH|nr:protein of unknown function [Agrobacterium pusense]
MDPPVPTSLHRRNRLSPAKQLLFALFDRVGVHVELQGHFYQRLRTSDSGKCHVCLKSRAVVPARSSCHDFSYSRHLSRGQAGIPHILDVQITRASSVGL